MAGTQSIATAYVQILPSTQGIGAGIAGALGGAAGSTAAMSAAAGGATGAFAGMTTTGFAAAGAAVAAGVAVIDLGKDAVKTGMEFDSSMSRVYSLMSSLNDGAGLTSEEMLVLENRAREMGASTQFTAKEAAEAMGYMALAGWDVDQIYEGLPHVLNLAAASSMDLGRASDIVTDYMAAFSYSAPSAVHLVDLLAYAQSRSNATTEQFSQGWKYSAGMMNMFGQSADTTTAILARLADQGHKASTGGVELNAVMTELIGGMDAAGNIRFAGGIVHLADATENFDPAAYAARVRELNEELAGLEEGSPEYEAAIKRFTDEVGEPGNFINMIDVFQQMQDILTAQGLEVGSVGYLQAVTSFFDNVRAQRGISAILNGDVAAMAAFNEALENSEGMAEKQAGIVNDNLEGDLKILKSALDELKIAISDKLTPIIRDFVQAITPIINWLAARIASKTPLSKAAEEVEQLGAEDWQGIGEKIQTCMDTLYNPDASAEEKFQAAQYLQEQMGIIANMDWTGTGADAIAGIMSGITGYNFHGDAAALLMNMQGAIDREFGISSPATSMEPTGQYVSAGIAQGLSAYDFSPDGITVVAAIQAAINAALAIADWTIPASLIGSGIARGINARRAPVISAAAGLVTAAKSRMQSLVGSGGSKFAPIGEDIAKGIAKGILTGKGKISNALIEAFNDAIDELKKMLIIGSPSRLFANEIGKFIPLGIASGISDYAYAMDDALSGPLDEMTRSALSYQPEFPGAGGYGYQQNITINSPRALSPWEVARQTRNATRQMVEAMA